MIKAKITKIEKQIIQWWDLMKSKAGHVLEIDYLNLSHSPAIILVEK